MAHNCRIHDFIGPNNKLILTPISPRWTLSILLAQSGLFDLDQVAEFLELNPSHIKLAWDQIQRSGRDPWQEIGVRRLFGQWLVWMEAFSGFYLSHLHKNRIRSIPEDWDANRLITQRGVFYLSDVCKLIPFTNATLRYKATDPKIAKVMGVRKDQVRGTYVVDMETFGPWLADFWRKVKSQ